MKMYCNRCKEIKKHKLIAGGYRCNCGYITKIDAIKKEAKTVS